MKHLFNSIACAIGVAISFMLGGFDTLLVTLCTLMVLDYLTGVMVALVFKKSPKSELGGMDSTVSFKGIVKKVFILVLVMVANRVDDVLGTNYIRGGVIATFIANETMSIIENAGIMGLPLPSLLVDAIDVIKKRGENDA